MSYPRSDNDFPPPSAATSSPFMVPIEVVSAGLVWLCSDPEMKGLKEVLAGQFDDVDELRAAIQAIRPGLSEKPLKTV
ncbi:MAG: hypothetical protein ACPG5T_09085, partial [Endozoicomonas sp.]